jgi:hypothetical protein
VPNLKTLMLENGPVIVDANNNSRRAKSIAGTVRYIWSGQTIEKPLAPGFISAVALGSADFIFDDQAGQWLNVSIKELGISVAFSDITDAGAIQQFTLAASRAAMRGVIIP